MNDLDHQQRSYVATMAERLRLGRIDRRQFIRAAGMAGFGMASAKYLTGCASAPAPRAEQPAGKSPDATSGTGGLTPQQQFLKEVGGRFKGTRIKIVSENTAPGLVISKMMTQEFTPLTGIEIDWDIVPLDQVLARTLQDTLAGARGSKGQSDIYYWDHAWLGRFVNDSIDIDERQAKNDLAYPGYDFQDFMPQLVDRKRRRRPCRGPQRCDRETFRTRSRISSCGSAEMPSVP